MTFKNFSENYDGCIYIICFEKEVSFSVFHYYFMKYENAIEYLWEYYLDHEGREASPEDIEHARWTLETTGYIDGVGHIDEEYFEDFDSEDEE